MSGSIRITGLLTLGLAIAGGSLWPAEAAHAEQRVNADRIIVLSDDIDKKTTGVTHNQSPAAPTASTPNAGVTPAGSGDGGTAAQPSKAEKPAKAKKPKKPKKSKKPKKPKKPARP